MTPVLSASVQAFFRTAYGLLLFLILLFALPHARRFFMSERWQGYAKSSPLVDLIQNPLVLPAVLLVWFSSAAAIIFDRFTVTAAFINLVLCWYFFIWMRWRSIRRGSGAPGFMTYWTAGALFLTEYTSRYATNLYSTALLVIQWDLAFIIFTSGFYKFRAGFLQNEGMEYGLANPEWGRWWQFYKNLPPGHWIFKIYDQLAWSGQILAAVLMLIPEARPWGGLLLIASFIVITVNIRLGFLSEVMMLCGVLFFTCGSLPDKILSKFFPASFPSPVSWGTFGNIFNGALAAGLWIYLCLLPLAYAGIYTNFYGKKALPGLWQKALEKYTNFFGMIIWRVFTVDLINFFIQIYRTSKTSQTTRRLVSDWGDWGSPRYNHVVESITVTSIFTTLKYYPTNSELFRERLFRYARTIPCAADEQLIFEYVHVLKGKECFEFVAGSEYKVDLRANTFEERILNPALSPKAAAPVSPIHEGAGPGSYRPLAKNVVS